jgi:RND family efflux transporter MFP subunit
MNWTKCSHALKNRSENRFEIFVMTQSKTQSILHQKTRSVSRTSILIPGAILACIVLLGGIIWFVQSNRSVVENDRSQTTLDNAPEPLPVNTISISLESDVTQTQSYTGTIQAKQSSDLAFELPGTVTEVLVREGDSVTKGQVLARLDTRTLMARRAATEAQLDQAKARLDELYAGPRDERIRSAMEQVRARESDYRLAALNRDRRQSLHNAGAVSDEEFDQARFGVQAAEANLKDARERLNELETGTRKEQLAAQASAVRQLESSLDEIDVSLQKSELIAPFAGTISRRYADNGSVASAAVPIVRLIESGNLEAVVGLPPDVAMSIIHSSDSSVTLNVGEREISASVRSRVRELDPVTRTQNILLDIDPTDATVVVPGELCEWRIEQTVNRSGFWLPASALTRGVRGLWSVMVAVDLNGQSLAEKRDIEIVLTESDRVLARGMLSDGDRVVLDGLHRVAAGQRIVDTKPTASDQKSALK